MSTKLYLNGDLTPGTKIYQEADGKKYYVSSHTHTCTCVHTHTHTHALSTLSIQ